MSLNRYIAFRMIVEIVGTLSCALTLVLRNDLAGTLVTMAVALVWVAGEVWMLIVLDRSNPRHDELSDKHQGEAMTFALMTLIAAMILIGSALTLMPLFTHVRHGVSPMLLPTLAIGTLAVSDARYMFLERRGSIEVDVDED